MSFLEGYLECALWASTDMETEEPLDERFDVDDFAPEAIEQATQDCQAFQDDNAEDLEQYDRPDDWAGHDFWLTRNGHGAGFWDRGLGDVGERLTEACKPYGEVYIYAGDDGMLYFG